MRNKKGMVLSIYVYILLVFFLLILVTMLTVLNNTKILATKMKTNVSNIIKVNEDFSIVLIGSKDVQKALGKFLDIFTTGEVKKDEQDKLYGALIEAMKKDLYGKNKASLDSISYTVFSD